jgi:hypothetical protein
MPETTEFGRQTAAPIGRFRLGAKRGYRSNGQPRGRSTVRSAATAAATVAAAVETATVAAAIVEATSVPAAVEVVIMKSVMEPAINKSRSQCHRYRAKHSPSRESARRHSRSRS